MSKAFRLSERLRSFRHAFNGLRIAFKEEHNFRIHLISALITIALAIYFRISLTEWLWVTTAISLVLVVELLNTSIENMVDLLSPEKNRLAGKVKDIAASAVLIISIAALAIGILVFYPYFKL